MTDNALGYSLAENWRPKYGSANVGYDTEAAPLSSPLQAFRAQRGQPGVIQKTLGLIPGFDQDGDRGRQSWGNALMSTAQFPIDAVAGIGQAITAPARAYRGEFDPVSEEGVGEALNVAGNAMMGGLAAPKPRNVVGSAGGSLAPDAAALDMSQAARMQRAKRMGYDTDTTWYHGTSAPNFDEFSPGKRGATFFSDQPYVTDYFANTSRTDGPARVIPTYSRANKLFDPAKEADNPNLAAYVADNINQYDVKSIINPGKTHTKTPQEVLNELRNSSFGKDMFEPVEHPVIQNWIKNNGYDGFVVNDGSWMAMSADKPARIMGVFDPSKIRSTNAAFDPAKADSANLLYSNGGKQGAGIGSAIGSAGGELKGAALGAIPDHPLLRQLADEGYDTSRMLHRGTKREEDGFRMDRTGTNEVAGIYTAPRERIAQDYGDFIHRGFLKNGRTLEMNARKWEPTDKAAAEELAKAGIDTSRLHDREMVQKLRDLGYTAVDQTGKKGNTWATVALNESDIRPITAAQAEEIRAVRPDLFANGGRPGAAAGAALGAIPDTPGIRAYHGSPHDFDRFDLSKIGTGEGAQAYGHGLYFAENEGVAQTYKGAGPKQQWSSLDPPKVDGKMYEVNIKANPDDFLDWDKPLSQQSEHIRKSMTDLANGEILPDWNGMQAYRSVGSQMMSNLDLMSPELAQRVKGAGIPGVKYLDQGSRTGLGEGTSNYVVFDDKLIEILRKYGLLGMAGGAAAAEYGSQNPMLPSRPASPQYRPGDA